MRKNMLKGELVLEYACMIKLHLRINMKKGIHGNMKKGIYGNTLSARLWLSVASPLLALT